ncbi:hypothetical protein M3221_13070 [Domibacillus indicus]|uniref:hypothetical protein n=1 Tax=Domibacillus indicus TaxID=1437523 RepID=UPI00203CB123|nr:hypothetical protein [Domibacillus indicus]MCM3789331.1 hypothetical protein [Domibacillus indicus]
MVWEQDEDEWFNDCPVIIGFKDSQLELCAFELPPTYLTIEVGDSWARGSSTPSNQANPVFQRFYDQA